MTTTIVLTAVIFALWIIAMFCRKTNDAGIIDLNGFEREMRLRAERDVCELQIKLEKERYYRCPFDNPGYTCYPNCYSCRRYPENKYYGKSPDDQKIADLLQNSKLNIDELAKELGIKKF